MTKLISTGNCWTAWLSCMTDLPLTDFASCSTQFDDWRDKTEEKLATLGLYFVEVHPNAVSLLPNGLLIGAAVGSSIVPDDILMLCQQRTRAREKENWSESDRLKDELLKRNWQVRDTDQGQVVRNSYDMPWARTDNQIDGHLLIANVIRNESKHGFEVHHDPAGKFASGQMIFPEKLVLLCRLDKT